MIIDVSMFFMFFVIGVILSISIYLGGLFCMGSHDSLINRHPNGLCYNRFFFSSFFIFLMYFYIFCRH